MTKYSIKVILLVERSKNIYEYVLQVLKGILTFSNIKQSQCLLLDCFQIFQPSEVPFSIKIQRELLEFQQSFKRLWILPLLFFC